MAPTTLPRPSKTPQGSTSTNPALRRIPRALSPTSIGRVVCPHCNDKSFSLTKHYSYEYTCAVKEGLEALASRRIKEFQLLRLNEGLQAPELWADEPEDMEIDQPDAYDWQHDAVVIRSMQDLGPVEISDLRKVPLQECLLESPPTAKYDHVEEAGIDIPMEENDIQRPDPGMIPGRFHVPQPTRYEPAGTQLFPSGSRAGEGYTSPENQGEREPTIFADWMKGFQEKSQGPIYGPFSPSDWEFTRWAKKHHLKASALNEFLAIPGVRSSIHIHKKETSIDITFFPPSIDNHLESPFQMWTR